MVNRRKNDLLADGDDEEVKLTINENYASKYNQWREKEEFQKLKDRYRDAEDEEESSEDDENAKDLPNLEKGYFKALSYLKEKDPRIYDSDTVFFPDQSGENGKEKVQQKNEYKPLFLKDYERKIIVEKGGILSDEDNEESGEVRAPSPTIAEEQKALKLSFKKFLEDSDSDEGGDRGNLLKKKKKSNVELKKEEAEYREWLKGHKDELQDKETQSDLKALHDYWCNPNLPADEAYLRDYILNKRYLEKDQGNFIPQFSHVDEIYENVDEQEEFEYKYDFRFEEPDPQYIKQYPRRMELSMRRKDDSRKRKRQEIRERKEAEMVVKKEEIKRLKALKKKEIMDKINKIKEVTGNDIDLKDMEDLEEDFDPQKHDLKMQELFNDDYYGVSEEKKPEFNEVDDYLDIENWEKEVKDADVSYDQSEGTSYDGPEYEDPNFNMDCDYDPKAQLQEELLRVSKSKKKQRRKSKLLQALARKKPVFDPNTTKFDDYFEEYYKLDCEDIIGDIPCRFKYRQTVPNNYGLTVDEILRADVRELNQWCSLKKVVKYKPEHVEKNEVNIYKEKAKNEALKRKILPSLYADEQHEDSKVSNQNGTEFTVNKNKKPGKKLNHSRTGDRAMERFESEQCKEIIINEGNQIKSLKKEKKKKPQTEGVNMMSIQSVSDDGQKRKKAKKNHPSTSVESEAKTISGVDERSVNLKRFEKDGSSTKKQHWKLTQQDKGEKIMKISEKSHAISKPPKHPKKHNQLKKVEGKLKHPDLNIPVSDVRLRAYGINPKKFKNKIKYGNKEALNY